MTDEHMTAPEEAPPPRPAFLNRLWMVFFQPSDLFRALGRNPAWFPMALLVAVGMGALLAAAPAEAWEAQMAAAGPDVDVPPEAITLMRVGSGLVVMLLMLLVIPFLISGVTYVVFVFMRGDNAVYKQHLSVVAHAGVVMLVGGMVSLPLQMATGDLEASLSIGSFFPFLADGFLLTFLNQLQLFGLWTTVVAGIGLAVLDERRKAGSTIAVLMVIQIIVALGCAGFATAMSPSF